MKTKTCRFIFSLVHDSSLHACLLSFFYHHFRQVLPKPARQSPSPAKASLHLAFFLLSGYCALSQPQQNTFTREQAIELMTRVSFDSREKAIRQRQKKFENATGLKVQFRVEDASLEQLGGLSEHLFKLFQSLTGLQNTNARTITGEFSLLENGQLRDFMSYHTRPTADLSACRLPARDTGPLDERYSRWLSGNLSASAENINEVPASIDALYPQAIDHYETMLFNNRHCPADHNSLQYNQHVQGTGPARALKWAGDVQRISGNLSLNYQGILNQGLAPGSIYGHFINLNNSVNECTEKDLESACRILCKKTNIHLFFVTHTLDYFIPEDSLAVFTEAAVASFSNNVSENLIIGLYLNMRDPDRGISCPVLLVSQKNGQWLSQADIDFANHNNLGAYQGATLYKFRNLIRNVPKPLILCYQVAKINGLLSTVYIEKAQHVKGREQIYNHVFQCDKSFDALVEMTRELQVLSASGSEGKLEPYIRQRLTELRERIRVTRIKALSEPELSYVTMFKETYLENKDMAQASALKYLKDKYGAIFQNNQIDALLASHPPPADIEAGSCPGNEESDLVADVLSLSSLLLSPVGLDILPDALSVLYFTETGQDFEAGMALGSMALPASTQFIRKVAGNLSDALHGVQKGEVLAKESGALKLVSQEANQVMTLFRLDPALAGSGLINKIEAQPLPAKELLSTQAAQARVFEHVTQHLDEPKRRDFVNKFLDDADFRNKVIKDPDEVLRWGGVVPKTEIDALITVTEKEDLPDWIRESFKNGIYATAISKEKIELFRDFGDRAFLDGSFCTTTRNATREQLALHPSFQNSMRFKAKIHIPANQKINVGKVGPFPPGSPNALPGGADQIILPEKYDHAWIKEIMDNETGIIYSVEQFKITFPNLVKQQ